MPHIANTYAALAILNLCGDKGYSKVDREKCLKETVRDCYDKKTGEFRCLRVESERDARFTYCACAISKLLGDMSYLDAPAIIENLVNLQTYTGGFAWNKEGEAHAGITYCVVASLSILKATDRILDIEKLVEFLTNRFVGGFNGRLNKPADCCYSFWCLASLKLLGGNCFTYFDEEELTQSATSLFNLECSGKGGFAKYPQFAGKYPDIYHTFYALSSFSLMEKGGVVTKGRVEAELGILS